LRPSSRRRARLDETYVRHARCTLEVRGTPFGLAQGRPSWRCAMEVFFCDRCSCRITEGELEDHLAIRCGEFHFCKQCWQDPEVRSAVAKATGKLPVVQDEPAAPGLPPAESRRTPPRTRPPTPPSLRPHHANGARRTPAKLAALGGGFRRGTGVTVAVAGAALGGLAGFIAVMALGGRASATLELRTSWVTESSPPGGENRVSLVGRFLLDKPGQGIMICIPSGGRWSVHVNGRRAYSGLARAGSRIQVGSEWLVPGWNEVRALVEGESGGAGVVSQMPRIERS